MAFAGYGSAGYASARLRCGPLRFGHTTQRDGGDQHVRLARVGGIPAGGFGGALQTVADRAPELPPCPACRGCRRLQSTISGSRERQNDGRRRNDEADSSGIQESGVMKEARGAALS